MARTQSAAVYRALTRVLMDGITPYRAAKEEGIALSTIYRAMKRNGISLKPIDIYQKSEEQK
jgi:hypothetical protein